MEVRGEGQSNATVAVVWHNTGRICHQRRAPFAAARECLPALTMTKGTCISQSLFCSSLTPLNPIMPCCALALSWLIMNVEHTPAMKQRHAVFRFLGGDKPRSGEE